MLRRCSDVFGGVKGEFAGSEVFEGVVGVLKCLQCVVFITLYGI